MARDEKEQLATAYEEMFDRVWTHVEQRVGDRIQAALSIAPVLRRQVQTTFLRQPGMTTYHPLRDADRRLLVKEFEKWAWPVAQAVARNFVESVANLDESVLRKIRDTGESKAKGRSYKTEEARARNLELLEFVAGYAIPLWRVLSGGEQITPGRRGPAVRAPWDALCEEWNRTHRRRYNSGKSLARAYYRAAETSLSRAYREQVKAELSPEELRGLSGIDEPGMEKVLDGVLLRFEGAIGERFAEDACQLVERAQALRRSNEADGICQATRDANEEKADALEQAGQALMRVSEVKKWVAVGGSGLRPRERSNRGGRTVEDAG